MATEAFSAAMLPWSAQPVLRALAGALWTQEWQVRHNMTKLDRLCFLGRPLLR